MSVKESWSELLFQGLVLLIAITTSFAFLYAFSNMSPEEKDEVIIILMMMGSSNQ